MNLLCKLGLHDWFSWHWARRYAGEPPKYIGFYRYCKCTRCQLLQFQEGRVEKGKLIWGESES